MPDTRPEMRQRALFVTSNAACRWNKMLLAELNMDIPRAQLWFYGCHWAQSTMSVRMPSNKYDWEDSAGSPYDFEFALVRVNDKLYIKHQILHDSLTRWSQVVPCDAEMDAVQVLDSSRSVDVKAGADPAHREVLVDAVRFGSVYWCRGVILLKGRGHRLIYRPTPAVVIGLPSLPYSVIGLCALPHWRSVWTNQNTLLE